MYEEPPPLPFPSLQNLKVIAVDILKVQRNPSTPDVEFKYFDPALSTSQTEKKKQRSNNRACDVCKRKKVRCDINALPQEQCTRSNCHCLHHVEDNIREDHIDSPSSSTSALTNNNNNLNDTIPSTTVFRKPGLIASGHYTGETSFCGYLPSSTHTTVLLHEDNFPTFAAIPSAPFIPPEDQRYLVNVYYDNMNPFYPLMNKQELLNQMHNVFNHKTSYLSPLFFYALFARAAHVETSQKSTSDNRTFQQLGDDCLDYASALANFYRDKPRVSTVLALIIMTNHLEQEKKYNDLSKSWLWAGDAFRMALDLGIHRSFISDGKTTSGQLCIRTFWLAYIADCTISMTYGRPSATEEKVLDVTYPVKLSSDDNTTAQWIDGLNALIQLSKVTARVIKFNYCPPPPFIIQGPVKRHNAFLVSVDSWLIDIMQPKEAESPMSNSPNVILEETLTARRITFQKLIYLYTNLILLHRPYVNDTLSVRNASNRPSYDICSYAAIIITDTASKLDPEDLIYHARSPIIAYALIMALRIHIMNATGSNPDKYNAIKNFNVSLTTLNKLPQSQDRTTMLHDAIVDLEHQFLNRFSIAQEREDDIRIQQHLQQQLRRNQPVVTAAQVVFSPGATEKRKEIANDTTSGIGMPFAAGATEVGSSARPSIVIKGYNHQSDTTRKKKKPKIGSTNQLPTFIDSQQQRQKQKQKQKQQKLQTVFSSNTSSSSSSSKPPAQPEASTKQQMETQFNNIFSPQPSSLKSESPAPSQYSFTQQAPPQLEQKQSYTPPSQPPFIPANNNDTSNQSFTPSTFASADFNLLQQTSNNYYSPVTTEQQQPDQMFDINDEIAFNQFLGQMQQQNMMPFADFNLSINSPFLFNNNNNQQQNMLTDELALYRVAPQEDTMGISITRATDNSPSTSTTYLSNFSFDHNNINM